MIFDFAFDSIVIGAGLAMDAFSVSLADGLNEPCMKKRKMVEIALCFSLFQFVMPLLGWFFVHTAVNTFEVIQPYIPWAALLLLFIIGVKAIREGLNGDCDGGTCKKLTFSTLMVQGVATSIDALSVGFTIADYDFSRALTAAFIIAAVTFGLCLPGVAIGKKFGTKIAGKANILGGVILIAIGIKICVESMI